MASDTLRTKGASYLTQRAAYRVGLVNLCAGILGTALYALFARGGTLSFSFGYLLGLVNILWLMRTARRGMTMEPSRAGRYVAANYFVRFLLTVAVFAAVIVKEALRPVPLVAGFMVPVALTITLTVLIAREESR